MSPLQDRDPFLSALGERVRGLRARKGMTRRALAVASDVSERHLANLELGVGNASVLVLRQVALALDCTLPELLGDDDEAADWHLIRELLRGRDEAALRRARMALTELFVDVGPLEARVRRVALIGLRGAGKSTLGRRLAEHLHAPFVELNEEIERLAGCSLAEIHNLYGTAAYRRYERRALEEVLQRHGDAVLATPGGIVSDAHTFNLLLANCLTVWLRATPEEHMQRVVAQGDLRPMAGNQEAMDDLRRILDVRTPFYGKADRVVDTSGRTLDDSLAQLRAAIEASRAAALTALR